MAKGSGPRITGASMSHGHGKVKRDLYEQIMKSTESSPELRKEIARVFQVANRRAQNIEKAGLWSPALQALENDGRTGYSKFNMKHDWEGLKREYAAALAFCDNGSSTATGARKYNERMMKKYGLSSEQLKAIHDKATKGGTLSETQVLKHSMTYTVIVDYMREVTSQEAAVMDAQADQIAMELQRDLELAARMLADQAENQLDSALAQGVAALNDGGGIEV